MTKNEYTAAIKCEAPGMADAIKKHLEADPSIAPMLTPGTLKNCNIFVTNCARKVLNHSNGQVADEICYKWARDYFNDGLYLEDIDDNEKAELAEAIKNYVPKGTTAATATTEETSVAATEAPKKKRLELTLPEPSKTKVEYIEEQLDLFG